MNALTHVYHASVYTPNLTLSFTLITLKLIQSQIHDNPGPEVIKLEYSLKLKIKRNDWLIADTCPQAANHYALF